MRRAVAFTITIVGLCLVPGVASAQRVIYFVRHAEKADRGPDGTDAQVPITPFGVEQADRLAERLKGAEIGAVYYSRFDSSVPNGMGADRRILRTEQTAAPLVKLLRQRRPALAEHDLPYPHEILGWRDDPLLMIPFAREAVRIIQRVQKEHPAEIILIVGHENTVPAIIRELAALRGYRLPAETDLNRPHEFIGPKEFGLLYEVHLDAPSAEEFLRVERYALSSSAAVPPKVIYPPEPSQPK